MRNDHLAEAFDYETILCEKKAELAYITVNRPKVMNAVDAVVIEELTSAFEEAADDPKIRGVILSGVGDKAFISGADLARIAEMSAVESETFMRNGQGLANQIEKLGKPTIAAVNGFALGGGCELALACTIRLATGNAKFGQPEAKFGIMPGWGGTQRLPRLIGRGRALQLILTGETIDAEEAYRIGLVNELVSREQLIPRAESILRQIGADAPLSIKCCLEAVDRGLETSEAAGLAIESSLAPICFTSEDRKEGAKAFLEKRAPRFEGR